MKFLCIDKVN